MTLWRGKSAMPKKPLSSFHYMVYNSIDEDGRPCDPEVETVYAYDSTDADSIIEEIGTIIETHMSTSFPRVLAHGAQH